MTERELHIGLVNNMPDAAFNATERQFRCLLEAAAEVAGVRLSLFVLPEVPRSAEVRHQIARRYASLRVLFETPIDGLIVTGTEPVARNLQEEPYWGSLTRLIDWAERNTTSSIWSCLAAHAALLHLDGLRRQPMPDKLFGVFAAGRAQDHFLTSSISPGARTPHSRWNDVPEAALTERGYQVLMRSDLAGADTFIKQRDSLFVFFQGHPEYDAASLLLEYRRDVQRFLGGQRDSYPSLPHGYFENGILAKLDAFKESALAVRRQELLAAFPTEEIAATLKADWRAPAVTLYRNWLRYLHAKRQRRQNGPVEAEMLRVGA